jgi:adenosylmethionine---8-amino-7-oxononanoate aminotransferase
MAITAAFIKASGEPSMTPDELQHIDRNHIWHPYAGAPNSIVDYPVERADDVTITLRDGRKLIDGMSSWWAAIHGYNHPILNKAISDQLDKMAHVMFGGFTHEPAAQLAKRLVNITPDPLRKVFFSDSGSVAVEVAIKMALQYCLAQGYPEKNRLLAIKGGYHGDTFAAMAVCDPVTGMHHLFRNNLQQHFFAERPACRFENAWQENDLISFKELISQNHQYIAAVILEPIVQGAGGMWFYSPQYLKRVRELCDEFDVLLILDEIATGFGRTGKLFGCEHANISPDIMCIGKALTGGYLTLAATLCTDKVAAGIDVLMHGPTFMANPLACAVASASIDLLLAGDWRNNIQHIEQQLRQGLEPAQKIKGVSEVRVLGAIGVIELHEPVDMKVIQPMFVEQGIWLRPFGRLVYMMPPYIATSEEITVLCEKTLQVLDGYLS